MKKRILWCGESSHIPSGFGNYTREILSRLYNTNKYELAELSCYRTVEHIKTEPWKVYPVAVSLTDPLYKEYIANRNNASGQWRFDAALLHFKPDIVIDIRDFWNFIYQESSSLRRFYSWIIAPTYDSSPLKIQTFNTFSNADLVLFHTEWAKNNLKQIDQNNRINIGSVVNDSVDTNVFKPIGYSKGHHKLKFGIDNSKFIIGTVMRNQKRKLIPDLFRILKTLIDRNNNLVLYLHTSFPELECWNLPSLLLEFGIQNHVYLTYRCQNCKNYWASVFKGPHTSCNKCKKDTGFICGLHNALENTELNNIYNLFDIYIQYAICEGFGIPQVEAASSGIPLITVDHGAMAEVGHNLDGDIVKIKKEFREMESEADRVYPDNDHCISIIDKYINMSQQELISKSKHTRQKLLQNYSWDKTAKQFEDVLDKIDISRNLKWDIDERKVSVNERIPSTLGNREFIYYIIDNIIYDAYLKKTNHIQELIKNLDQGFVINTNHESQFTKADAVKLLEIYISNKIAIESIRTNKNTFPEKYSKFLNY